MPDKPTISQLFAAAAKSLTAEFENIRASSPHPSAKGTETEEALVAFLNNHVPTRWKATRAVLMDFNEDMSREVDVAIFDCFSSAAYRTGSLSILPNDSVAVAIEVKTSLDSKDLEDAYEKIESCKRLAKKPLSADDRRTTEHDFATTSTLGVVFAYSSNRSIEAVAEQMVELNHRRDSSLWPDLVVVLDKGVVTYACQYPGDDQAAGFAGALGKPFSAHPMRFYLAVHSEPDLALHRFVLKVLTHLSAYPFRLSIPPFSKLLQGAAGQIQVKCSYQFGLDRVLHADPAGTVGKTPPTAVIEVLADGNVVMELEYYEWQDGGVVRAVAGIPFHELLPKVVSGEQWDGVVNQPVGMVQTSSVMKVSLDEFSGWPARLGKAGIEARILEASEKD